MVQHMLTTTDNPYDPFDEFDEWYAFDLQLGYDTLGLLARVGVISNDLSEADEDSSIKYAIDEIVRENVSGVHKLVVSAA